MSRIASGELRKLSSGYAARVTLDGRARKDFPLPACATEAEARVRCTELSAMAARLRRAGQVDQLEKLLSMGASARAGRPWEAVCAAVDALCRGEVRERGPQIPTFEEFARQWTSGELAKKSPDHVADKSTAADDVRHLRRYVTPVLNGLRLDEVTLADVDRVMSSLPEHLSPSSRRHVAQVIRRVLTLAVYPARHIKENPIPKGWLPRGKSNKAFTCLYPAEDALLMACGSIPLVRRMFFGVLAREGMRREEAGGLRWRDVDLVRGMVRLDENKTDDPRAWALDPGVARALRAWRKLSPPSDPGEYVFQADGRPLYTLHLADDLRADLTVAGATRAELFERTDSRRPLRVHDLRATFVTLALANGQTETWVADRTGHRSSTMINRYRRQARTWAELGLGRLAPLDEAIPELAGPIAPLLPHAGQSVRGPIVANLAEREGFEPSVPLRVHMISKLRAIMGILARSRKQA